ncbi:MAG TPA: enoyl-CoA hydratase/isomerase family protein [Balneolales bacterium]|nr:enoyl-CoA hydratase/isomerase family protein [Balneolales bacterium]
MSKIRINIPESDVMVNKSVTYEIEEKILWAKIARPRALNAIDFEVMEQLESILDLLEKDEAIRVFILSGEGHKSFVSGGDLRKFSTLDTEEDGKKMAQRMTTILKRIEALNCITIACINGDAYGGGCETTLAFDFRIAAEHIRFGFTQARFYLPPGWGGLTRLVELVGRATALEWLASSAIINSRTALDKGLINKVVSTDALVDETKKWAEELSQNDRHFIRSLKENIRNMNSLSRDESLEVELSSFIKFWASEEHFNRIADFLNRNKN